MGGWFNSKTFEDHNGQPSFVRKSLAWILLFAGGLILLGVVVFGLLSLDVSKEVASFIIKALAAMTGVVGIAYGAMQGAKGYAQGQAAKGGIPDVASQVASTQSKVSVLSSGHSARPSEQGVTSTSSGKVGQTTASMTPSTTQKANDKADT